MGKTLKSTQSRKKVSQEVIAVPVVEEVQSSSIQLANTPDKLIAMAIQSGNVDINALERLMDLQERWLKRIAHEKFIEAMSGFQSEVPPILKHKSGYENRYQYADLNAIDNSIKGTMRKYGLTKTFKFRDFVDPSGKPKIEVSCVISHLGGHSETTSMEADHDASGKKNDIQARGSSLSYQMRYTIIGALGLTTADQDNDGQSAPNIKPNPAATKSKPDQKQFEQILSRVKSGEITIDKVKSHFEIDSEQEKELLKVVPVKLLPVDDAVMKVIITQVRGGLTLEEVKNKFAISEDQKKIIETIINSKKN